MLASWDKLWWASLHPQKFQKILVCSKKGFTVFTGPPWVTKFLFRPPLFLCHANGCVAFPRACTCLKNESPSTSPSRWPTHCAWAQPVLSHAPRWSRTRGSFPCQSSIFSSFSVCQSCGKYIHVTQLVSCHRHQRCDGQPRYLYLVWGRFFLEGKM